MMAGSLSYTFGPLMGLLVVALFIWILRWAFSPNKTSLVAKAGQKGRTHDYGSLVPVAAPGDFASGEVIRSFLESKGVKANLASTLDGPRIFVFSDDAIKSAQLLASLPQNTSGLLSKGTVPISPITGHDHKGHTH
jgi:hypothetical protein